MGECIVLHIGGGRWFVVDSCRDPETREPIALKYLSSIGVGLENVVGVVTTHWHDDHTKGISEVIAACANAEFFCSAALGEKEFFTLVATAKRRRFVGGEGSGIDEMHRLLTLLAETKRKPEYRAANQILYRSDTPVRCVIEALSPSSASQTRAFLSLAPKLNEPKGSIPNPGPNELSVAIHLAFGDAAVLLGADLETGTTAAVGWRATVANPRNNLPRANIVKVAHHGSAGADHDPAWVKFVSDEPHVAVTPFASSRLPRDTDLQRLRQRSQNVFHTSPSKPRKASFDRATERTLGKIKVTERGGRMGHIRFRTKGTTVSHLLSGAAERIP